MRYKNYNKVLNWQEITELVKQETLALSVPNGLIVIKQNDNLLSDINFFIQVFKLILQLTKKFWTQNLKIRILVWHILLYALLMLKVSCHLKSKPSYIVF